MQMIYLLKEVYRVEILLNITIKIDLIDTNAECKYIN